MSKELQDGPTGLDLQHCSSEHLLTEGASEEKQLPSTMGRILTVANQKGGVGKTTTAVNLSAALAALGARVLLVDMDPQANASSGMGIPPGSTRHTAYDLLMEGIPLSDVIVATEMRGLDLIPATPGLVGAEVELVDQADRDIRLHRALRGNVSNYHYVLIDCPPSLGLLTLNALVAADAVLIPLQCEYFALEGVGNLLGTIGRVREGLNSRLEIEGVVLTMYDGRLNLSVQVADEARRHFGDRVYKTMIPRNVRLGEAPSFGKPIHLYDSKCIGSVSYDNLAREVMGHE